ncbi:hypothetical protein J7I44_13985 [Frateuria sp. MAH-13]|uniref:Uncharacterized protein n=1 Tax=Frateuria flava TaxID=2821489 RepID=A0ABS4DQT2_9GAMM|nr:hypothetical protein [Frateuria flava]MBP1475419.1 hypothetical protein [Frateuria flava]
MADTLRRVQRGCNRRGATKRYRIPTMRRCLDLWRLLVEEVESLSKPRTCGRLQGGDGGKAIPIWSRTAAAVDVNMARFFKRKLEARKNGKELACQRRRHL